MQKMQNKIWQLGNHRLACGDSTDKALVDRLVGDETIRTILCDPPYGVAYVENKDWIGMRGGADGGHKKISNDQLQTDEQYTDFTARWLGAVKDKITSYNQAYIFNCDLMMCALRAGMEKAGWKYSQMIIWIKNTIVLGRKDYNPQHEIIAYGWMGRHKFARAKGRSVICFPKPTKAKLHPTMKPVGLLRKILLDSTKVGDTVYDPFGGSGSTMVACENLKRRCFMIEMDEVYCKVIIDRWEKASGGKAELL